MSILTPPTPRLLPGVRMRNEFHFPNAFNTAFELGFYSELQAINLLSRGGTLYPFNVIPEGPILLEAGYEPDSTDTGGLIWVAEDTDPDQIGQFFWGGVDGGHGGRPFILHEFTIPPGGKLRKIVNPTLNLLGVMGRVEVGQVWVKLTALGIPSRAPSSMGRGNVATSWDLSIFEGHVLPYPGPGLPSLINYGLAFGSPPYGPGDWASVETVLSGAARVEWSDTLVSIDGVPSGETRSAVSLSPYRTAGVRWWADAPTVHIGWVAEFDWRDRARLAGGTEKVWRATAVIKNAAGAVLATATRDFPDGAY